MHLLIALAAILLGASLMAVSPLTPVEQLGKQLFFDRISSPTRSQSCASCHAPDAGWTGAIPGANLQGAVYRGAHPGRFGNRKPPTSAYAAFGPVFHYDSALGGFVGGTFWDGRATGERLGSPVAEQALGPFLNPVEQNLSGPLAVCEAVAGSKYAGLFEQVWGSGSLDCSATGVVVTYDRIGLSIAAYEGSTEVNPFSSRFDDYWRSCLAAGNAADACGKAEGDKAVLDPSGLFTAQEFAGLLEFGEYCSTCHVSHEPGPGGRPPLFTTFQFHNIGVPKNPKNPFYEMDTVFLENGAPINPEGAAYVDYGLGDFLRSRPAWADLADDNDGKHKVPTVRNVAAAPGRGFAKAYMHNGAFNVLADVVHFYNTRDIPSEDWPAPEVDRNVNRELFSGKPMGNFELDAEAEAAIVAFLGTLSDRRVPGLPVKITAP